MLTRIVAGAAAGAVGSSALNIVTYLDMVVRGRPSSSVPADVAGRMTDAAGIELAGEGEEAGETADNRRSGLGALFGYVAGLGVGAGYGVVRSFVPVPLPLAAVALGGAAMAASDVPATATGATDPREWTPTSWASDIVPHLAYGLATAAAYEAFMAPRERRWPWQ